jgi:hypothetical protein
MLLWEILIRLDMVEVVLLDFGFRVWYCWISDFGKIMLCDDCLHSLERLGGLAMIVLASFW